MAGERTTVEVAGRQVAVSNLDKVMYPATGFTKAQVLDYYVRVAPTLLPHLRGRPLTLKRYPDGVAGGHFYEKNCPSHRPGWVHTAMVGSRRDGAIEFCVVDDLPALVWVANLASLELHPYLHRADDVDTPTMVVFDLDPGAPAGLVESARVALQLKAVFDELGLVSVVKTSGSKGMQVYIPLNTPTSYERTTPFARAVARLLERREPDRVVSNMRKDLRAGRVLVDWSQNSAHKTTVGPYSLRARETPTVSAPVGWEEVEEAVARGDADRLRFGPAEVLERVGAGGDLFAPVLDVAQRLPDLDRPGGPGAS